VKIVIPVKWLVDMAGLEGDWKLLSVHRGIELSSLEHLNDTFTVTLILDQTLVFHDPPEYKASDVISLENPRPQPLVDTPGPESGWKEMLDGLGRFLGIK